MIKRLETVLRECGFEFVSSRAFNDMNSLRVLFRHGPSEYSSVDVEVPFFEGGTTLGERLCNEAEVQIRAFAKAAIAKTTRQTALVEVAEKDTLAKTARRAALVEAAKWVQSQGLHYGDKTVRELSAGILEL